MDPLKGRGSSQPSECWQREGPTQGTGTVSCGLHCFSRRWMLKAHGVKHFKSHNNSTCSNYTSTRYLSEYTCFPKWEKTHWREDLSLWSPCSYNKQVAWMNRLAFCFYTSVYTLGLTPGSLKRQLLPKVLLRASGARDQTADLSEFTHRLLVRQPGRSLPLLPLAATFVCVWDHITHWRSAHWSGSVQVLSVHFPV